MSYVAVEGAGLLKPGEMKKFTVSGEAILIANVDGSFYAIANTCTHMGGSLANGVLEGSIVRCPRHGAQYDVKTGANVGDLTMLFIKKKTAGVKSYPVQFQNDVLMVELS